MSEQMIMKYPLLFGDSEYAFGMDVPASERLSYSAAEIQDRGAEAIGDEVARIQQKKIFEWKMDTYRRIMNQTIALGGVEHFEIPNDPAKARERVKILSVERLPSLIEDLEIEIENTAEIKAILTEQVFSDRVKDGIQKHGVAAICQKHFGYSSSFLVHEGSEYDTLEKLTTEKLKLLDELRDDFTELKKIYVDEFTAREALKPKLLKTLLRNVNELIKAGIQKAKELRKASKEYEEARNSENRAKFRKTWDEFNAIEAKYTEILNQLHGLKPDAKISSFPLLDETVWRWYRKI